MRLGHCIANYFLFLCLSFRCLVTSNSSLTLVTLDCGGVVGRIVTVNHPQVPLTLCEVEVYSTLEHPENIFPQRPARYSKHIIEFCNILAWEKSN